MEILDNTVEETTDNFETECMVLDLETLTRDIENDEYDTCHFNSSFNSFSGMDTMSSSDIRNMI